MNIERNCKECLYKKQVKLSEKISDEAQRELFLADIRKVLEGVTNEDTSPYIVSLFREIQIGYGIDPASYPKEKYNRLMLDLEDEITKRIESAEDPLAQAIAFARVGNYIDFGAMAEVNDDILMKLINEAENCEIPEDTYKEFCEDCAKGKTFLLLCDNCGEIVLDKLFFRQLKKKYPLLTTYAMVRDVDVLNDATRSDAAFTGLDTEATIITNGCSVAGTVPSMLRDNERQIFDSADVILSKGQGNFESLLNCDRPVYYSFLCKCELFTGRFNVPKYTGMFIKK